MRPCLMRELVTLASTIMPAVVAPQAPDTTTRVTVGGFVDSYYTWDFGRPPTADRSFAGGALFTTQPARHNEFGINLAFVGLTLEGARVRGRVALQAGTSVQSNYAAEPTVGAISGPVLTRHIQEAYAGTKVGERLWVDAGVFFSNVGMESWISRDNPTYTRSLVADYSPYYSSGVRAVIQASPALTAHLHVVNGWQNVAENNTGKGVGIRLNYAPTAAATVSYYNLFTDEMGNRLRTFNGVGAKISRGSWTWLAEADYGVQDGGASVATSSWYGLLAIARVVITPTVALSGRAERYVDDDQTIVVTGLPAPLHANGMSVGVDVTPAPRAIWRTEARGWRNARPVFPDGLNPPKKTNAIVVSSLAVTF